MNTPAAPGELPQGDPSSGGEPHQGSQPQSPDVAANFGANLAAERAAQSGIAGDAMTVEWTLAAHPAVAEVIATLATCVREADCIRCFVVPAAGHEPDDALEAILVAHIREALGNNTPHLDIRFVDSLPKTRTGKVMRWVLDEGTGSAQT